MSNNEANISKSYGEWSSGLDYVRFHCERIIVIRQHCDMMTQCGKDLKRKNSESLPDNNTVVKGVDFGRKGRNGGLFCPTFPDPLEPGTKMACDRRLIQFLDPPLLFLLDQPDLPSCSIA